MLALGLLVVFLVSYVLFPAESDEVGNNDFRAAPSEKTQEHLTSAWEIIIQNYFRTPAYLQSRESLSLHLSEGLLSQWPMETREAIDNYSSRFIESILCNSTETECLLRDRWVGVTRETSEHSGESVRTGLQEHPCEDLVISALLSKHRETWKLTTYNKTCVILELSSTLPVSPQ